jgi:hypothetical protein
MVGAIATVQGVDGDTVRDQVETGLYPALAEVCGMNVITRFNDQHCKTADDAIAALEIAGDLAAAEGK